MLAIMVKGLVDYLRLDEADQQVLLENHTDLQVHAQTIYIVRSSMVNTGLILMSSGSSNS